MVPVTALTATTTAIVKSAGNYGTPSPKLGSPIAPIIHTPTSTSAAPPSVPIVDPKPVKEPLPASSTAPYVAPQTVAPVAEQPVPIVNKPLSSKYPADSPVNAPAKAGSQGTVETPPESSGTSQTGSVEVSMPLDPHIVAAMANRTQERNLTLDQIQITVMAKALIQAITKLYLLQ